MHSTSGQHETVLALVHDPAGVANAECRPEEDAPIWQTSLAAHICIGVIVQTFQATGEVRFDWPSTLKSREMEKPLGPKKSHAIQNSPHIWCWLAEIAFSAP